MVNLEAIIGHFIPSTTEGCAHVLTEEGGDLGPALVRYGSVGFERRPEVVELVFSRLGLVGLAAELTISATAATAAVLTTILASVLVIILGIISVIIAAIVAIISAAAAASASALQGTPIQIQLVVIIDHLIVGRVNYITAFILAAIASASTIAASTPSVILLLAISTIIDLIVSWVNHFTAINIDVFRLKWLPRCVVLIILVSVAAASLTAHHVLFGNQK